MKTISESFLPIANSLHEKIASTILNTLKKYVVIGKDTLDHMSYHKVVYRMSCYDCNAIYRGQTKRQLKVEYPNILVILTKNRVSIHNFEP